ncbi:hypothetical protein H696_02657 [Fonticula alba]|uniref:t-SNARE coiled-coil homology domain-containing protein n=1 Tax=Fonticula alba TaxID=691883 RepID=A0A058Z7S4_FONAL|nr:hypothetical protein H696_02657 [Fonticula alba]KCV70330.1 hypothetical protein H696_02657 [Fonticula alba]|eukprot:XP_009494846.1 hypothetical protein H696_02657 [Fonticula alba]
MDCCNPWIESLLSCFTGSTSSDDDRRHPPRPAALPDWRRAEQERDPADFRPEKADPARKESALGVSLSRGSLAQGPGSSASLHRLSVYDARPAQPAAPEGLVSRSASGLSLHQAQQHPSPSASASSSQLARAKSVTPKARARESELSRSGSSQLLRKALQRTRNKMGSSLRKGGAEASASGDLTAECSSYSVDDGLSITRSYSCVVGRSGGGASSDALAASASGSGSLAAAGRQGPGAPGPGWPGAPSGRANGIVWANTLLTADERAESESMLSESRESTSRMVASINETSKVAVNLSKNLYQQGEQIDRISGMQDEMEGMLVDADRDSKKVSSFWRGVFRRSSKRSSSGELSSSSGGAPAASKAAGRAGNLTEVPRPGTRAAQVSSMKALAIAEAGSRRPTNEAGDLLARSNRDIDEGLDTVSGCLDALRDASIGLGLELDRQNSALGDITVRAVRHKEKLKQITHRLK